jgi:hypothetical protein
MLLLKTFAKALEHPGNALGKPARSAHKPGAMSSSRTSTMAQNSRFAPEIDDRHRQTSALANAALSKHRSAARACLRTAVTGTTATVHVPACCTSHDTWAEDRVSSPHNHVTLDSTDVPASGNHMGAAANVSAVAAAAARDRTSPSAGNAARRPEQWGSSLP